ncbi:MAG: TatD family hydrolase [Candidatus Krumholzibacteriia bacterium]
MIDSHVHLNRAEFDADRTGVVERAATAGVTMMLEVAYDLLSSEAAVELASPAPERLRATVGIHPHDALLVADAEGRITAEGHAALDRLRELAARSEVVAVGEIGLDFYRDLSPRPAQRAALAAQLRLAGELDLPVIFHTRDAYPELIAQVEEAGVPRRGAVLHSFAGDDHAVAWARRHGVLLGIGGPVTYKNSRLPGLLAAAAADLGAPGDTGTFDAPAGLDASGGPETGRHGAAALLDLLLLETDAPWLPPVPHRGQRNEPAYLRHTRDRLAEVLGVTPQEVERRTDANFTRLFLGGAGPVLACSVGGHNL